MARYGMQTKLAVLTEKILGNAKGGIYENLISEMLVKAGYSLHYFKTENSSMEIEFVIERDGGVIPVEVKAGNTDTPSLNWFVSHFDSEYAIKLIDGNLGVSMAIRIISMAEAAASIDPFASVEDFWWTMLHDYLPQYEEYSNSVKTELGIKCKSKHFSFDQFNCTQTPAGIFAINSKLN